MGKKLDFLQMICNPAWLALFSPLDFNEMHPLPIVWAPPWYKCF